MPVTYPAGASPQSTAMTDEPSDYQRGRADAHEAAVMALASWLDPDVSAVLTESLFYAVASQVVSPSDAVDASRDPVALARLILSSPEPFRDPEDGPTPQ